MNIKLQLKVSRGLTLIELLITLSIISILLFLTAPTLSNSLEKRQADKNIHQLLHLLALARTKAVTINQNVTLCGVSDNASCKSEWNADDDMIVFIDKNYNFAHDIEEPLLASLKLSGHGSILWKGSGKRPYFRYNAKGYANEFGSFTYCPPEPSNKRHIRQIVISLAGRARLAIDKDHNGIVDNSNGDDISC